MHYDILHELPGRMRVRCRIPRLSPEYRLELRRWVSGHSSLVSASISTRTGNLLLLYSREASREDILLILDDLRLFGAADIETELAAPALTPGQAAVDACLRTASKILVQSFLPRPLRTLGEGLHIVRNLFRLVFLLGDGQTGLFAFRVARFVAFALLSSSLPFRFLLSAGFSALETVLPASFFEKQRRFGPASPPSALPAPAEAAG